MYAFCDKILCQTKHNNLGDDLNIDLIELISKKILIKPEYAIFRDNRPIYSFIGSILEYVCNQPYVVTVWGTGFKYEFSNLLPSQIRKNKYLAVRGPLTRNIIQKAGGECPTIYGDPGILISRYIKCEKCIKYQYGIIPHKSDMGSTALLSIMERRDVKVISLSKYRSLFAFIEDVNSCRYILSSSLHGIIISDSYQVPNLWVKFSLELDGGDFKFKDYFMGVKKSVVYLECFEEIDFGRAQEQLGRWEAPSIDPAFINSFPLQ